MPQPTRTPSPASLTLANVCKSFPLGNRTISVLDDVSLRIDSGEFVAIMGRSGSGKSTLLSIMAGLDAPDSGTVQLGDLSISTMSEDELALIRQTRIGFIFQSFHLIPTLSVAENIAFPLQISGQVEQMDRVDTLIEQVELGHRRDSMPHQLSGGEKQRTAIARALVARPQVLFADEPTGNLDAANADQVLATLTELQQAYQTTLIVVTHDPAVAALASRTVTIVDGQIAAESDLSVSTA